MRVWLLDVEMGGRTLRLSTQPVSVEGVAYAGTLDRVELREQIDGVGTIPSERSAQIGLVPPDDMRGYSQIQGRATLSLWSGPGTAPRVELVGDLVGTEIGQPGEPCTALLTADSYADRGDVIDGLRRINEQTWPESRPDDRGRVYPRIWGTPGRSPLRGGLIDQSVIELIAVEFDGNGRADTLLLCDGDNHDLPVVMEVIGVDADREDSIIITFGGSGTAPAPLHRVDGEGNLCIVLDCSGVTSFSNRFRRAMSWYGVVMGEQAIARSRTQPGTVRTVGHLLQELAAESTIPVDIGEWAVLADRLPYRVGLIQRDPIAPLDLAADIIRDLPVAIYTTPRGLAAVRWPYDARRTDAVAVLVEGRNCSRVSGVRQLRQPADAVSTVAVEYAYSEFGDRYRDARYLSRQVRPAVDLAEVSTDLWARTGDLSGSRETLSLDWCWEDEGAEEAARWALAGRSIGAREIMLEVDADLAERLLLASVVLLRIPTLGLVGVIGIVAGRTLTDRGAWPLRVVLLSPVGSLRPLQPLDPVPPPTIDLDPPPEPGQQPGGQ